MGHFLRRFRGAIVIAFGALSLGVAGCSWVLGVADDPVLVDDGSPDANLQPYLASDAKAEAE